MAKIIPYLLVSNGKEAIEHYKDLFGAKLRSHQPFSQEIGAQMGFPEDFDYENSTMHAELKIKGSSFYLADNSSKEETVNPSVEVVLDLKTQDQIEAIYKKVAESGATIKMKLEKTFWDSYYARFSDKYGVGWQLNYSIRPKKDKKKKTKTKKKSTKKLSTKPTKKSPVKKSTKKSTTKKGSKSKMKK